MLNLDTYGILSQTQELDAFERLQNGDDTARDELILHNLRFVYKLSQLYASRGDMDDITQAAVIGLMTAIDRFDPTLGYRLLTYAKHWMHNSIQVHLKRMERVVRTPQGVPVTETVPYDDDVIHDSVVDSIDTASEEVEHLLATIDERSRIAVRLYYGIGTGRPVPYSELGRILGMSHEGVRNIVHRAIKRMSMEV